jgi:hypothetical protein
MTGSSYKGQDMEADIERGEISQVVVWRRMDVDD